MYKYVYIYVGVCVCVCVCECVCVCIPRRCESAAVESSELLMSATTLPSSSLPSLEIENFF